MTDWKKCIGCRISDNYYKILVEESKKNNKTVAEMVRYIICDYLQNRLE